jgi:hypothetical protein
MYLRTCGGFKSAKKLWFTNPKSTKYKSANHKKLVLKSKILKMPHLRKSANITTYSSVQICGFAICKVMWRGCTEKAGENSGFPICVLFVNELIKLDSNN